MVRARLAATLSENGEDLLGCEVETIQRRPYSTVTILRARTSLGERKFAMKTVAHHPINREILEAGNQAVVEFEVLCSVFPVFSQIKKCHVPRPILVLPEIETYLMEYVAGDLLMDHFRACRFIATRKDFERLREDIFLMGKWLKIFQQKTGYQRSGPESLAPLLSRAEQRLILIEERGIGPVPRGLGMAATALLRGEVGKVGAGDVLVCGRHGDFTPLNVIVGDEGITVIDYLGYEEDCVGVDIMKMLVFLADESRSVTTSSWKASALRAAFLEGYGELPWLPRPVVVLCEAMQRLVSLWGALSARGWHPHHWWENRLRIHSHVDWFTDAESRTLLWPGYHDRISDVSNAAAR